MTKDNSEANTTSPIISGNERHKSVIAYYTTFLILLLPEVYWKLYSVEGALPSWDLFLYPAGGVVGALICGVIYWRNRHTSSFVAKHAREAAKINVVCFIALTLIITLFFNLFDGPEALLPGTLAIPFVCGGPVIAFVAGFSIYSQKKN